MPILSSSQPQMEFAGRGSRVLRRPHRHQNLDLGLGQSGTTVLYQILKESLPDDAVCLFEPRDVSARGSLRPARQERALQGFAADPCGDHYSPQACAFFNKRIFLRRDPRDLLVSVLLYNTYDTAITHDFWKFAEFPQRLAGQGTALFFSASSAKSICMIAFFSTIPISMINPTNA